MLHDHESSVKSAGSNLVEDGVTKPWTVFVMRDAVIALYPWDHRKPIQTHALAWARCENCTVWIYEVDEALPVPQLGQRVVNPSDLGWVQVGRRDAPDEG